VFLDRFNVVMLKIIFLKKNIYIISIYFQAKIILKSNRYHNTKQTLKKIANCVFGIA
jgi:hypothetical protein